MDGLEGKLEGVNIGDIIVIQGKSGCAAGYVESITPYLVVLSPRDITSPAKYKTILGFFPPTSTDYRLEHFEAYEVLKKRNH